MATSRSSRSSEPPPWLRNIYERRRLRTIRLIELSIATLEQAGEKPSLAAIARVSKTVDPAEPDAVSASAILHNEEAYALYRQHADRKRQTARKSLPHQRSDTNGDNRIHVSANRDRSRVRQRYLRANKTDLVERLLVAEQAYAEMEDRWLRTADDLVMWIMLVDRLLAAKDSRASSRL